MDRHERQGLCVALDGSDRRWLATMAGRLSSHVGWLKIGLEAFTAHGRSLVEEVVAAGTPVFLDLKLHDIPTTVRRAAANIAGMGVGMLTVHAAGGPEMVTAAREGALEGAGGPPPKVIAVTVLTSLDRTTLQSLGIDLPPEEIVGRWARLARDAGLDGVVASAQEAPIVRAACGPEFLIVTPGIRPAWAPSDDQRRIVTPAQGRALGADILVVGRPVTRAADPADAADRIAAEMAGTCEG